MKTKTFTILFLTAVLSFTAFAALTGSEKKDLFQKANSAFTTANQSTDPQTKQDNYKKAILAYETIITQGNIRNPKLYYNLANAYFLNGQIGKAILNYRKAENLDDSDINISKNLNYARSKRIDKFETPTEKKILQTLFFWHYDLSIPTKFTIAILAFAITCIFLSLLILIGRKSKMTIPAILFFLLFACLLCSVIIEQRFNKSKTFGVITAETATARQGDSQSYAPTFTEPLHEGTEFDLIEKRGTWLHILLPDGTDTWIQNKTAEII